MYYLPNNPLLLSNSINLLNRAKGRRIIGISKLLECDPDKYLIDFKGVSEKELFSFGPGPVFMELEGGLVIGLGDDQKKQMSVVAWEEKTIPPTLDDSRQLSISKASIWVECGDVRFSNSNWSDLIGQRIDRLSILRVNDPNRYRNERGLLCITDLGREFVFSLLMRRQGPGDFLMMPKDEIATELLGKVTYIDI
jgi:hypothetical protein